jgi:hypothetical protein
LVEKRGQVYPAYSTEVPHGFKTGQISSKEEKKQMEIDFIANLGSRRYYIQSAFSMPRRKKDFRRKCPLPV